RGYPATDANWRVTVRPLLEEMVGGVRALLWVLFAAVGFVLLIACTNVAGILLAPAVARGKGFVVRAALGAGRGRLVRQAMTESLLIACGGTAVALILAQWGLTAIVALSAGSIPRFEEPELNPAVLGFSAGLALLTTLLVGLAPAVQASAIAL